MCTSLVNKLRCDADLDRLVPIALDADGIYFCTYPFSRGVEHLVRQGYDILDSNEILGA